ncbi:MAG TPA: zinc ribbon domain-containing protein [Phycisphaerae bacterium]|nr:zinc ribbon domain-containing protein [Phycisphaerae bacterium]
MPTYEYTCAKCGTTFELFQSITAKPFRKHECPACGTVRSVRRLIGTGGGIIFKGSGFYETDYRSKHYRKAAKADKEAVSTASSDNGKGKGATDGQAATTAVAEKPAPEKKAAGKAKNA